METIAVSNNKRATRRLCHVELRHFSIPDWVKNCDIILKSIASANDRADELTNALGPIWHRLYADTLLGNQPPSYQIIA